MYKNVILFGCFLLWFLVYFEPDPSPRSLHSPGSISEICCTKVVPTCVWLLLSLRGMFSEKWGSQKGKYLDKTNLIITDNG